MSRPWAFSDRRCAQIVLVAAILVLAAFFAQHAWTSSLRADGTRVFWLDDDQMISMRYARNLAHGDGPVWNPGERVEGYTNFGWMMVMAAVHLTGVSDARSSLVMEVIAFACCCGVLVLLARMLRALGGSVTLSLPAALLVLVTCRDFVFWGAYGFEVPLLALLQMVVVLALIRGGPLRTLEIVALAAIPIVRADAIHIWAGNALLLVWLSPDRKRVLRQLGITLLPFAAHLAFRRFYYGEWVPNTFLLKVGGLTDRFTRGQLYVQRFLLRYWLPLLLCAGVVWRLRHDRRRVLPIVLVSFAAPALYSLMVGGDNFAPCRFFGPFVPVMIGIAALAATHLSDSTSGRLVLAGALMMFSIPGGELPNVIDPSWRNGNPPEQIAVGLSLRKNASPEATVAVIPGGFVPYFSRLRAVDMLGKSDRVVARLPPVSHALAGHGKLDPVYSLGTRRPDYFVSCRPRLDGSYAPALLARSEGFDYALAIMVSRPFRDEFEPFPVPDDYLNAATAVYVRRDSRERDRLATWRPVAL